MGDGSDAFVQALCRKACAQIIYAQAERQSSQTTLRQSGRAGTKPRPVSASSIHTTESVTDTLADIAAAFIEKIGRSSTARAQLAGRSSCSLLDVLGALEDLPAVTSSSPRDLARYAMYQEIPFPQEIPRFPVLPPNRKRPRELFVPAAPDDSGEGKEKKIERPYIEPWMPPLPSAHTYVATPIFVKPEDKKRDAAEVNKQRSRVEKSLAVLKESKAKVAKNGKDEVLAVAAVAAPRNPYLALPKVGNGRVFDNDDQAADVRVITEPVNPFPDDELDSNQPPSIDAAQNAANDQKRARVDRILAEASGGTTAVGGQVDVS